MEGMIRGDGMRLRVAEVSGYHHCSRLAVDRKIAGGAFQMTDHDQSPPTDAGAAQDLAEVPRFRPTDRFWPYVDLPEQPTPEELAALDPDLHDALFGRRERPFSITVVFPKFEGEGFERAMALARGTAEVREVGQGDACRVRARFSPADAVRLRDLFEIVGAIQGTEVLVDDRPVPYARELWLPLVWFLIPR